MLIFDRFPTREKADEFAWKVGREFRRLAGVYMDQPTSDQVDVFPFELTPPIVLVLRLAFEERDYEVENQICELVKEFDGQFAGT